MHTHTHTHGGGNPQGNNMSKIQEIAPFFKKMFVFLLTLNIQLNQLPYIITVTENSTIILGQLAP